MRNKTKVISVICILTVTSCLVGIKVLAGSAVSSMLTEWGSYLSQKYYENETDNTGEIYAQGERASITNRDIEQVQKFYILTGMEEQVALEKAVQYVKEREALYQAAMDNGYAVTDEEVWAYLEELKKVIQSADNKEDAFSVMRQFDSEEDYWNYEFLIYQKNLPIQNYVRDMEQMFMRQRTFSDNDSNTIEQEWQLYFEQIKEELVKNENYQVISD